MASSTVYLLLLKFAALALCRHVFSPAPTTLFQQGSISPLATTTPLAVLPRENPPPLLTNSATCGYTSGLWFSAFACPSEFTCNYYTTPYSAPNFGCCSSGDGCGYVSTCLNYNTSGNLNTGAGVLVDGENFFWYVCHSVTVPAALVNRYSDAADTLVSADPICRIA